MWIFTPYGNFFVVLRLMVDSTKTIWAGYLNEMQPKPRFFAISEPQALSVGRLIFFNKRPSSVSFWPSWHCSQMWLFRKKVQLNWGWFRTQFCQKKKAELCLNKRLSMSGKWNWELEKRKNPARLLKKAQMFTSRRQLSAKWKYVWCSWNRVVLSRKVW